MGYIISENLKTKIASIPNFKTDTNRIKSISTVKSIYGIGSDETIISYRVIPKVLAKLETGGTIFTDRGIYRRLPSGYLSSDYVTYGLKYIDMVDFIPWLGYSVDRQPQLIGEFTGKRNCQFWLTPVLGTESNWAIVDVFKMIIDEVASQDEVLLNRLKNTYTMFLKAQESRISQNGCLNSEDVKIIKMMVEEGRLERELKADAIFLVFKNEFASRSYADAYAYVEKNSDLMLDDSFMERIDPVIRNKISTIGVPQTSGGVKALELYCEKNSAYVPEAFPNIIAHYFNTGEYTCIDNFMKRFYENAVCSQMEEILNVAIERQLDVIRGKADDEEEDRKIDEFMSFSMRKPIFFEKASRVYVGFYTSRRKFEKAEDCIKEIKEISNECSKDSSDLIDELSDAISKGKKAYVEELYADAQKSMQIGKHSSAIDSLRKALEIESDNKQIRKCLCKAEIGAGLGNEAMDDIRTELGKTDYDETERKELVDMAGVCARMSRAEMSNLYEAIQKRDYDALKKDERLEKKRDQFGLGFFHYIVLLKRVDILYKLKLFGIECEKPVCGYDIRSFAAAVNLNDTDYSVLFVYGSPDAEKELKEFNKKKFENKALGVVESGFRLLSNQVLSHQKEIDDYYARLENEGELTEEQVNNKDMYESLKTTAKDLRENGLGRQSMESIESEYYDNLIALAGALKEEYKSRLPEMIAYDSFRSKAIFLIMKNPGILRYIYQSPLSSYISYIEGNNIWYLPSKFIDAVNAFSNPQGKTNEGNDFDKKDYKTILRLLFSEIGEEKELILRRLSNDMLLAYDFHTFISYDEVLIYKKELKRRGLVRNESEYGHYISKLKKEYNSQL